MGEVARVTSVAKEADVQALTGPRVAFLTNVIPPYHKPVLDRLSRRYSHLRILLSIPMESNRAWSLEWQGLDVVVQKTVTWNGRWRHPKGFSEPLYVHLPLDTFAQLKRFGAEVVISAEMGARTFLAAAYRLLHPHTKLIIWADVAESTEQGRGLARAALRGVLRRAADGFLVTGESGVKYIRSLGVRDREIFKIGYTTDIARFAEIPLIRPESAARRLLYVGQLIERKGLLPLIAMLGRWAALYPHRWIEFVLAGSGPLRERLEQHETPQNLKLTFLGDVPYQTLPDVYARAGIFVFPTFADTWGVVVNEALAAGLPVLGSTYGQAISELVSDGMNGWTFRPDREDEMLAAIARCLTIPLEELDRMRRYARETALRLTPDYVADLIDAAIQAVLGERSVAGLGTVS